MNRHMEDIQYILSHMSPQQIRERFEKDRIQWKRDEETRNLTGEDQDWQEAQIEVGEALMYAKRLHLEDHELPTHVLRHKLKMKKVVDLERRVEEKRAEQQQTEKEQSDEPVLSEHDIRRIDKKIDGFRNNVNAQDIDGNTALHLAALGHDLWLSRKLIAAGASRRILNNRDQFPSDLATGYSDLHHFLDMGR